MNALTPPEIRRVLERVDAQVCTFFEQLAGPYEQQVTRSPGSLVGRPLRPALYAWRSPLEAYAARLLAAGHAVGALYRVVARERQLERLGRDHGRGRNNATILSHWIESLEELCRDVRRDIVDAHAAAETWHAVLPGADGAAPHLASARGVLTPKDAASLLGLDVAALRRLIRAGRAGPWQKVGGRWKIRRQDLPAVPSEGRREGATGPGVLPTPRALRERFERLRRQDP